MSSISLDGVTFLLGWPRVAGHDGEESETING